MFNIAMQSFNVLSYYLIYLKVTMVKWTVLVKPG